VVLGFGFASQKLAIAYFRQARFSSAACGVLAETRHYLFSVGSFSDNNPL
jgi:hypothetical protein